MSNAKPWVPAEPNLQTITARYRDPLRSLARAEIPALVLRRAYDPDQCQDLVQHFIYQGLMRDPSDPSSEDTRTRIDIGTSLGNLGNDKEVFLKHAEQTHELFEHLFEDFDDPLDVLYDNLSALAPNKEVKVARESDGRPYGPAIFRVHYTGHAYKPHIDHVTLREKRFDYAVTRFQHQFAGILCIQNASHEGRSTQAILHNCLWSEEIQPYIEAGTFHEYASKNNIGNYRVDLAAGDLYFFNTRCIHEVPAIIGTDPRIVLAVFIGYSEDDPDIYVWS